MTTKREEGIGISPTGDKGHGIRGRKDGIRGVPDQKGDNR